MKILEFKMKYLGIFLIFTFNSVLAEDLLTCRKDFDVNVMDSVVGIGFDDLTHETKRKVLHTEFRECKATPGGEYIVADNVGVFPIYETVEDETSTAYKSFNEYLQDKAYNFDLEFVFPVDYISLSGTLSNDYLQIKQYFKDSKMLVTKIVQTSYKLNVERALFGPSFQSHLNNIAAAIENNLPLKAQYLTELLVNKYGTHVVMEATVGSSIEQRLFVTISDSEIQSEQGKKDLMTTRANFFKKFGSAKYESVETEELMGTSTVTIKHRTLKKRGTVGEYQSYGKNLVPLTRKNILLYQLVKDQPHTKFTHDTNSKLCSLIRNATLAYFELNTIYGCTNASSPNFDFSANMEDGSCEKPSETRDFGGVFQTCVALEEVIIKDTSQNSQKLITPSFRCDGLEYSHPMTKAKTCPQGFTSTVLFEKIIEFPDHNTTFSEPYYIISHRVVSITSKHRILLTSYWCKRDKGTDRTDGEARYGGYIDTSIKYYVEKNPSCTSPFEPYFVGPTIQLCLSYDTTIKSSDKYLERLISCESHHKRCHRGYRKNLLTILNGCAIHACTHSEQRESLKSAKIKLLPVTNKLLADSNHSQSSYIISDKNGTILHQEALIDVLQRTKYFTNDEKTLNKTRMGKYVKCLAEAYNAPFACLYIDIVPLIVDYEQTLPALGINLAGIPAYFLFIYWKNKPAWLMKPWICFTHAVQVVLLCVSDESKS